MLRSPARRRASAVRPTRGRLRTRRAAALTSVTALLVGLAFAVSSPAVADPPPNPSDAQIGAAQAGKDQLAAQVGSLTAQLASLQNQVAALTAAAELAEQKVALAVSQLQDAKDAAASAKADVTAAQTAVDDARKKFNASVRAGYTSGSADTGAGLLTADDPNAVLAASDLQRYVSEHQVDGIGALDRATVAKANADATARAAVDKQTQLEAAAEQAMADAQAAQAAAQAEQQQVTTQEAQVQTQLDTAQATLLGLQNQRAAFDAYQAEQARIAAAAEAARQAAIVAQQQANARALAAAAASKGSGAKTSSGSSSGSASAGSGNPSGGSWSAAKGQAAVDRAMQWVGEKYSFAAGNASGPTWGVCGSHDAGFNDCHVFGFDCSGLTLYSWAPSIRLDHYAATQYGQAGSYHPGLGQLMPGDLLFYGPSRWGIHHVAMYVGGGNVIQAPQSGDVVKITPVNRMGSDYYGATRPLT